MTGESHGEAKFGKLANSFFDDLRQIWFWPEFRIAPADFTPKTCQTVEEERGASEARPADAAVESASFNKLVVEFSNCLWYLKTKYFKRDWSDLNTDDENPRVRRSLSRLCRTIAVLQESGIEVQDPTNERYPQGGEAMMRPIQLVPTDDIECEMVLETVTPIIYRDNRLIQRGEVFVAVPK